MSFFLKKKSLIYILPVMMIWCETWALDAKMLNKIQCTRGSVKQREIGREYVGEKYNMSRVVDILESEEIEMAICKRWAKQVPEWYPWEWKDVNGKTKGTLIDEIRIKFGVQWMGVVQNEPNGSILKGFSPIGEWWITDVDNYDNLGDENLYLILPCTDFNAWNISTEFLK